MEIKHRTLKIGEYEICPLPTGLFGLDGGAMFGTVPKVLWEKAIAPDEKNRIPMEARALLLKSPGRCILVDCGNGSDFVAKYGEKLGSKFSELYNIDQRGPSLKKSLAQYGICFEDITDVILTHLHFDHAGGGTLDQDGKIVPAFPKAKYYLQRKNLETAQKPNLRERASYFSANFQPLIQFGVLKLLEGDTVNLLPGISVYVTDGHTLGQQVVKVSDGNESLLYCGDLVPTSAHVRLPWLMGYDLNPLLLMEEKQRLLAQAAEGQWLLFFEHDPHCDAAHIEAKNSDFAVKDRFYLGLQR